MAGEEVTGITVRWSGKEFKFNVPGSDTVGDLKRRIADETHVDPKRQKLIGLKLKTPGAPSDQHRIEELALKATTKLMMMGQPDEVIAKVAEEAAAAPEVEDDFDIDRIGTELYDPREDPELHARIQKRVDATTVEIRTQPRPGKKCLVLDIDYTLFDLGSTAERPDEMARPYLHEFLRRAHENYDIIIWSATSMKWVEVKMRELGVLGNDAYGIVALVDSRAMISVSIGGEPSFSCKPLQYIWKKFDGTYTPDNTLIVDDLSRNFVMNPQQGLKCVPFRHCHTTGKNDTELRGLADYLDLIAPLRSLAALRHSRWQRYVAKYTNRKADFMARYDRPPRDERDERHEPAEGAGE
ncbi:unnamed protein product [Pedinophyceae sp. YPF-701]|nr:unnamed protein product [Pedinophyceae sp. YPF-701]